MDELNSAGTFFPFGQEGTDHTQEAAQGAGTNQRLDIGDIMEMKVR